MTITFQHDIVVTSLCVVYTCHMSITYHSLHYSGYTLVILWRHPNIGHMRPHSIVYKKQKLCMGGIWCHSATTEKYQDKSSLFLLCASGCDVTCNKTVSKMLQDEKSPPACISFCLRLYKHISQ